MTCPPHDLSNGVALAVAGLLVNEGRGEGIRWCDDEMILQMESRSTIGI